MFRLWWLAGTPDDDADHVPYPNVTRLRGPGRDGEAVPARSRLEREPVRQPAHPRCEANALVQAQIGSTRGRPREGRLRRFGAQTTRITQRMMPSLKKL